MINSKKKSGKKVSDAGTGKPKKKGYEFSDRRRDKEAQLAKAKADAKEKSKRAVGSEMNDLYGELKGYEKSCLFYKNGWEIPNQDGQYAWGFATDNKSDLAKILKNAGSNESTKAEVHDAVIKYVSLNSSKGSKPDHREIVKRVLIKSENGGHMDLCRIFFAYEEAEKNGSKGTSKPVQVNSNSVDAGWFDEDILGNHKKK